VKRHVICLAGALTSLLAASAFAQDATPPVDRSQHGAHEHSAHAEAATDDGPSQSEQEHVPPDPPQTELQHPMPYQHMVDLMEMDDRARFTRVMLDRVEWRDADGADPLEWDAFAWYGSDFNKLWLETEGERRDGSTEDARVELLWDRIFSRWWSVQTGIRQDFGAGPSRTWAAFGVQGLAPYFFEMEATACVGEGGRTAARLSGEYDLLLTQRLVLQPELEFNLYGKADPERRIGSGLSDLQIGLRLRYEVKREFAPYLGIVWTRRFGKSADFARAVGEDAEDVEALAGLRIWF
jgi:copper resistance protein B